MLDSYRILKRAGKFAEAKICRDRLVDTMYSKEHLKMVMNMDFLQPREKMKKIIADFGVDIRSEGVQSEFRKMQMQNLVDVRMLKEGKTPPTQEELDA